MELQNPTWIRHVSVQNAPCGQTRLLIAGEQGEYTCWGKAGKYVTVHSPGVVSTLSLCEVEVYSAGPLVSRGRSTAQSSQHFRYGAQLAVDGSRNPTLALGSCSHTMQEESPWWRVALDSTMRVQAVVVTNRVDAYGDRLSGAQVRVSDDPAAEWQGIPQNRQCGEEFSLAAGESREVVCNDGSIPGRFIFIVIPGPAKILSLCEVEVYGVACDQQCYSEFVSRSQLHGSVSIDPGLQETQTNQFCHELSPTGMCDRPQPLVSTRSHVSTWGVDH